MFLTTYHSRKFFFNSTGSLRRNHITALRSAYIQRSGWLVEDEAKPPALTEDPVRPAPQRNDRPTESTLSFRFPKEGERLAQGRAQPCSTPAARAAGILFHFDPSYGIYVANLVVNSPAHRCGAILLGDCLAAVDGAPLPPAATLDLVSRLVLGPAGTHVTLSFRRPGPQARSPRIGGSPGPPARLPSRESWFTDRRPRACS